MSTEPTVWIAFLRAINLGAKRKFPKTDIIAATEAAGGVAVRTHINTGNVWCRHPASTRSQFEASLEAAYAEATGFEVPVIAFTPEEFGEVATYAAAITNPDLARHYIYLLKSQPDPAAVAELGDLAHDAVQVRGRAAHVLLSAGIHRDGTVDPYKVEKRLGVVATNRNLNVVGTIAQKWCGGH